MRGDRWQLFAALRFGQCGKSGLVEAEAFGRTSKQKDAFGEQRKRAEGEDERCGSEFGLGGREEPNGSGRNGENEIQGSTAGMVFEVAGEVFEKEFAERHAGSVRQNSKVSQGVEAQRAKG